MANYFTRQLLRGQTLVEDGLDARMSEGTPERAMADARAWIEEIRVPVTMDRHRRLTKGAVAEIKTAVELIRSHSIRRLRALDSARARQIEAWWKERLDRLPTTDPALAWVWAQRNSALHRGDDVAIWNWDIQLQGDIKESDIGVPVSHQFTVDPWGNILLNGSPAETSRDFFGGSVTVHRTIVGAAVPPQYSHSSIPDLLSAALAATYALYQEVEQTWA